MEKLFDLGGKVAVVTGASSGLGRHFVDVLSRAGADIVAVDLDAPKDKGETNCHVNGREIFSVECDVSDPDDVRKAVEKIEKHFYYKRIDILVNNAGVATVAPSDEHSDSEWERIINTNLNGVFYMSREVGKIMIKQGYGKIINLGSIHSRVAMPDLPIAAYCASKGGVFMLTKSLAVEWASKGITVNAIGPSYFPSNMTKDALGEPSFRQKVESLCPMGRVGKLDELSGALLYFASDASSFTTGQLLNIDGGWTAM